ncbi:MAG: CHRD domain-containing protein [Paracoccaceae bacterium]
MLLRFLTPLFMLVVLALAPADRASAATVTFTATLSGANEEPVAVSTGTGFATVIFDTLAHLLSIEITFADLTAPVTVAHIHAATAFPLAGNVGVAVQPPSLSGFPTGVTSGAYSGLFDTLSPTTYSASFVTTFGAGTLPGAEAALLDAMKTGRAYVNIHTSAFPAGEIRGFLQPVAPIPLPAGLPLLLAGIFALATLRRSYRCGLPAKSRVAPKGQRA